MDYIGYAIRRSIALQGLLSQDTEDISVFEFITIARLTENLIEKNIEPQNQPLLFAV